MSDIMYRVAGDVGAPPVSVTLLADGTGVNLTAASIDCYLINIADGTVATITGLSGTASGVVSTPLSASVLVEGVYTMEWEVVDGATYPAAAADRPLLVIRSQGGTP